MLGIHLVFVDSSKAKFRFFFYTSRPSARHGHWFLCHIEALYETMVIDLFKSRPYARQWSLISFIRWWPSTW